MGQALAASVPSDDERVQYGVSSHGFLPEACVSRLPSESVFEPLEALADELPRLNREGALRAAVDGLVCDISAEDVAALGVGELRRAYVVCAYLTHAYAHARGPRWELIGSNVAAAADAHGASGSAPRIPSALARALVLVCARIGLPPVLTAAATDLWNWRLVDPAQPLALDNLTTITSLTGTPTEVGFHMLPCAMHALFAPLLGRVYRAPLLDDAALTALLNELADVLVQCKALFKTVGARVDREVFYHVLRPLFGGFYPTAATLEGTATIARPDSWIAAPKGPSAGQSTMFVLIDSLLGVAHRPGAASFQDEMLQYMPPRHAQLARDFRRLILARVGAGGVGAGAGAGEAASAATARTFQVSILLFTVTLYANLAHSITRSP
jgi:indoleamine 2,3-dioxygenase